MKPTLCGLSLLLLVSPAAGQLQPQTFATQLGKVHFPGSGAGLRDEGKAVEVLPSGAVLVAGDTHGSLGEMHAGPRHLSDVFLARFDPQGELEWIRQIGAVTAATIPALAGDPAGPGGDASSYEVAGDLAVAADGSIYVVGSTYSSLGETSAGDDVFLAKFDAQGSLLWLRQLGVESARNFVGADGGTIDTSGYDYAQSLAIDLSGAVYVAGATTGSLGEWNVGDLFHGAFQDVFLARFSAHGRLEWLHQMGASSSPLVGFDTAGFDYSAKIALHPSGTIALACSSYVFGDPWWDPYTSTNYVTLLTFDAQGVPLASKALPSTGFEEVGGIAIDEHSGRIFVAGTTLASLGAPDFGGFDAFAASFDADLDLEWLRQLGKTTLGDAAHDDHFVSGLSIDPAGDLVLAGTKEGGAVHIHVDGPGATGGGIHNIPAAVLTAKLSGSDGALQWLSLVTQSPLTSSPAWFETGAERVNGLAVGPDGAIVVTGSTDADYTEPNAGQTDVLVMRLTPDGKL